MPESEPPRAGLSPQVKKYNPSLLMRLGEARDRTAPPVALIIHNTGPGPAARVFSKKRKHAEWREKHPEIETPFQAADWLYTHAMKSSGHFLFGDDGEVVQHTPEHKIAWHVGKKQSWHYRNPWWSKKKDYAWWVEDWKPYGIKNPRELAQGALWHGGSCNNNTFGLEFTSFSDAALKAADRVIVDLFTRHSIPATRFNIFGHCDAHPIARTRNGLPYDPREDQWSWEDLALRIGGPF